MRLAIETADRRGADYGSIHKEGCRDLDSPWAIGATTVHDVLLDMWPESADSDLRSYRAMLKPCAAGADLMPPEPEEDPDEALTLKSEPEAAPQGSVLAAVSATVDAIVALYEQAPRPGAFIDDVESVVGGLHLLPGGQGREEAIKRLARKASETLLRMLDAPEG